LRIYLERSGYLFAWKAASGESLDDKRSLVPQAVLSDDLDERLKKDETTASLEVMKVEDPAPIIELLREVKGLIPALNKK
jgi:hypothetical protein